MSPDPVIKSILVRYEKDLPVSTEEKAMLHTWLINTLKSAQLDHSVENKSRGGSLTKLIRNFTSGFFRIFASCPPVKK